MSNMKNWYAQQYKNMNWSGENKSVSVLFEHVFSEEKSDKLGSRRFLIRVLEFGDTRSWSIGFSRQWLAPDGQWIACKKGHAYFPIKTWNELSECFGPVSAQIKAFFENGSGGYGRLGSNAQGSHVNAGVGSVTANAVTVAAPATSGANGCDDADGGPRYGGEDTITAETFAPKTSSANIFGESASFKQLRTGGNVCRRGGAKRAFGQ